MRSSEYRPSITGRTDPGARVLRPFAGVRIRPGSGISTGGRGGPDEDPVGDDPGAEGTGGQRYDEDRFHCFRTLNVSGTPQVSNFLSGGR